jgi:GNAT superfamily N-acetyltransferase
MASTDFALLDFDLLHSVLTTAYWSTGIPRKLVEKAAANSLAFGLYDPASPRGLTDPRPSQIGYARVVTDRASFAYLADVFIVGPYRGRGLSRLLIRAVLDHPDLQGLRRFMLLTRDAHRLYGQFGFTPCARPQTVMERWDPEVYSRS